MDTERATETSEVVVRCYTCAFYVHGKSECRYNPPTIMITRQITDHRLPNPMIASKWPYVSESDWCGHWRSAMVGDRRKTFPKQVTDGDI